MRIWRYGSLMLTTKTLSENVNLTTLLTKMLWQLYSYKCHSQTRSQCIPSSETYWTPKRSYRSYGGCWARSKADGGVVDEVFKATNKLGESGDYRKTGKQRWWIRFGNTLRLCSAR